LSIPEILLCFIGLLMLLLGHPALRLFRSSWFVTIARRLGFGAANEKGSTNNQADYLKMVHMLKVYNKYHGVEAALLSSTESINRRWTRRVG
jgi:hypothetical protein